MVLSGPSGQWVSLGVNYDALNDQQTGHASSDIVGNGPNPGFMTMFDPGKSASATDGYVAFRVRLDEAGKKGAFDHNLWVGMDADLNGSVDVFFGVITQGNRNFIGLFGPGKGANSSPSTTTIESTPYTSYTIGPDNYNYRAVDDRIDGGTTNDLSPGTTGDIDYYLSFMFPFQDVVDFLALDTWQGKSKPQISMTDSTALQYMLATSTNINSLNQDFGVFSPVVTVSGLPLFTPVERNVPEISTSLLSSLGMIVMLWRRRR